MHATTLTLPAGAKINLYLDILSRRDNGYHDILSLMQSVGLSDTITLTSRPVGSGITLETDVPGLPCDRGNLAYRAAERFGELLGRVPDVHIAVEKHIPMAAGLGGGSADAAAVLRGLDRLYGTGATRQTLCRIGAGLGADIPFCIVGGAFIAEGIGEVLTPCRGLSPTVWLVIACGGEGVSTPAAYGALDAAYDNFRTPRTRGTRFPALLAALETEARDGVRDNMYNIFEQVVLPTHSLASRLLTSLREDGAYAAMMSGSGPSVFGLFEDGTHAQAAATRLQSRYGVHAVVTHPTPENQD